MKVPIVFLDFNGVLNSDNYLVSKRRRELKHQIGEPYNRLDPRAVSRLESILSTSGASIVISSTWKYEYSHDVLQKILVECGSPSARVVGSTPKSHELDGIYLPYRSQRTGRFSALTSGILHPRGYEIDSWVLEHADMIESYAILDDDADMVTLDRGRSEENRSRLVKTHSLRGLLQQHVDAAIGILRRPYLP